MKKQLLSIFATLTIGTVVAQTPSPSWTIAQDPTFSTAIVPVAGTRFLDAVDANVVWLSGYDGSNSANYCWYSRTINGGNSYNSGPIFGADTNTYKLSNMEGVDANTAWVCSYKKATQNGGAIHKTTNGGGTWTNMTAPGMYTNTACFGNFVVFLTANNGIVNGDPVNSEFELWTTTNGGTSWTQVPGANIPNPLTGEYAITNLYCKDGTTNVWYGTNKGRVFRTTDAGATWNVANVGTAQQTSTVVDVAFSGPLNGICVLASGANIDLYNSVDGGATWNLIPGGVPANFGENEITGIPGTTYFASVDNVNNMLSYSTDMGVTWNDWGSTLIPYVTIDFVNSYTGWVGGFEGFPLGFPGIFKYNGVTFNSIFSLPVNICKPNSTVTVSPVNNSTGAPPLTFSWSAQPAGAVFSSATASVPVITFSAYGTYTITLSVLNGNNQLAIANQIINVLSCGSPTASFNIPATVCNNAIFTLTNTSTGVPLPTFTITTSATTGVTVTPVTSTQFVTMKFAAPGIYTITSTASSISGSNSASQTINVLDCSPNANFYFYITGTPSLAVTTASGCADGDVGSERAAASTTNLSTSSNGSMTYTWSVLPTLSVTASGNNSTRNYGFGLPGQYTVTLKVTNLSGTTIVSKTIDVNICTGLAENFLENNLNIYPNPAREQLNIDVPASSNSYRIKLINVVGSVVYDEKINKNTKDVVTINLVNKAKGIYFLSVESNSERVVKKIVVE